jgi:hypothetical protein
MIHQLISLVGAAMILGAYAALQQKRLGLQHRLYHALNFVGSGLLTVSAVRDLNWGFIVLEGSWALLSVPGLLKPRIEGLGSGEES